MAWDNIDAIFVCGCLQQIQREHTHHGTGDQETQEVDVAEKLGNATRPDEGTKPTQSRGVMSVATFGTRPPTIKRSQCLGSKKIHARVEFSLKLWLCGQQLRHKVGTAETESSWMVKWAHISTPSASPAQKCRQAFLFHILHAKMGKWKWADTVTPKNQ